MLFLLSPAKSLDYETPLPAAAAAGATRPHFMPRAAELIEVLKPQSAAQVAALMDLSPALAHLNVERYAAWSPRQTVKNSRPAAYAFDGDVYGGLDAWTLDDEDMAWAQQHLAILSGLYGVLRPLDRLQPYRLEMHSRLATAKGRDLYDFWGDSVARYLNRRLAGEAQPVVVNLASQEYFRVTDRPALKARVVECVFEDFKAGVYKVISFHAKRARGLMARHIIVNRITTVEGVRAFDAEGYGHVADASTPDRLVFRRRLAD